MLKIGIMGLGKIAGKMVRTAQGMEDVCIHAVGSRSLERAGRFAGEHGIGRAYGSYEELAADSEVDLIYVATPHSRHYEDMKLCIGHRKNVLCEKAFTLNAPQAREVLAMARQAGVLCTEGIWTRYLPSRKMISDIISSGAIGTPVSLTANLGYELTGVERLMNPSLGGGALLDVGVYAINFALMVLGEDYDSITSGAVFNSQGADVSEGITITWSDGRLAVLHATVLANTDRQGTVFGDKGFLVIHDVNNCAQIDIYDMDRKLVESHKTPEQITGFEYEVDACRRAIGSGSTECPQMPHASTVRVMEMMDTIRGQWGYRYPCEM